MRPVLVLSPLGKGWGNQVTATRIAAHLERAGCTVSLHDPAEPPSAQPAAWALVVAFHALRSGQHLPAGVPAIIILGGDPPNPQTLKQHLTDHFNR